MAVLERENIQVAKLILRFQTEVMYKGWVVGALRETSQAGPYIYPRQKKPAKDSGCNRKYYTTPGVGEQWGECHQADSCLSLPPHGQIASRLPTT